MPYSLKDGRALHGPSGALLAYLDMYGILAPAEASNFGRQVIDALNAPPWPAVILEAARAYATDLDPDQWPDLQAALAAIDGKPAPKGWDVAETASSDPQDAPEVRAAVLASAGPGASPVLYPWLVLDGETGARETPLRRFRTHDDAAVWIGAQSDQAKVLRGGYSLEGPADDAPDAPARKAAQAGPILLDVTGWDVVNVGGGWRHVNHARKLATSGWISAEAARANAGGYKGDPTTLAILARRYAEYYPAP